MNLMLKVVRFQLKVFENFASYCEDFRFQYLYQINLFSDFNFKKSENDLVGSISRTV